MKSLKGKLTEAEYRQLIYETVNYIGDVVDYDVSTEYAKKVGYIKKSELEEAKDEYYSYMTRKGGIFWYGNTNDKKYVELRRRP